MISFNLNSTVITPLQPTYQIPNNIDIQFLVLLSLKKTNICISKAIPIPNVMIPVPAEDDKSEEYITDLEIFQLRI